MSLPFFSSYEDVLAHLDKRGLFHMDFGLERIGKVLHALNIKRPSYAIIQVVGTNGKGSTSTFLASLAKAHGKRVGLYTSPHFITPRERIRINGAMLEEDAWPRLANAIFAAGGEVLTYFEFLTVLAGLAFAETGVDVAVMEAGLGGSWDATTAMAADLLCVTPIGLDHQAVLGDSIAAIAQDKSGAIREGQTVFMAPQEADAMAAFRHTAHVRSAEIVEVSPLSPLSFNLGLQGPHQCTNAALAMAAWKHLAQSHVWPVDEAYIQKGLATARIAGRYDHMAPPYFPCPMILDGAHNPHGLQSLAHAIHADKIVPRAVIFACLADKDIDGLIPLLLDIAQGAPLCIPTIQNNERALNGAILAERINSLSPNAVQATAVPSIREAVQEAISLANKDQIDDARPIVLCGSLYLLAEFFTLYPDLLD